jgi:hypothetical protein
VLLNPTGADVSRSLSVLPLDRRFPRHGIDTETLIACLWSPSLLAGDGLKLSASVADLSCSGWAPLP